MKTLVFILLLIMNFVVMAEDVGSGFSYQGELLDNGSPANDNYDFMFLAYDAATEGVASATTPTAANVTVSNGLFYIESIDFGDSEFIGETLWLEVHVRKTSEGGDYSALSPRQRISAVPYAVQSNFAVDALTAANADNATNAVNAQNADSATMADTAAEAETLAAGSANLGDVLRFDGVDWIPVSLDSINQSPWSESGADVYFNDGDVGIGIAAPSANLHVHSDVDFELARFDGGTRMFNTFYEDGTYRGYIGSYQDGTITGTNTADFEVGTAASNSTGSMHLTTKAVPRLTVSEEGQVGVGATIPLARFQVDSGTGEDPLRVRINGLSKFWVKSDSSTNAYGDVIAHQDLTVKDELNVQGDAKQDLANNGMAKYLIKFRCRGETSSIISQYNGTNTAGSATIADDSDGYLCQLNFPFDIKDRYWVVTLDEPWAPRQASCGSDSSPSQAHVLHCSAYTLYSDPGLKETDVIMNLIVY